MGTQAYLGEVKLFGFSFAPRGFATAQGQLVQVNQNSALFALYGTTYGGNGSTTFALPNLGGRVVVGQGQSGGSNYTVGQQAGTENATLTANNLPPHTHTFSGTFNALQVKATTQQASAGSLLGRANDANATDNPDIYVPAGTAGTQVALGGLSGTNGVTGNGAAFSLLQPLLAMNYCVALQGVFPSRS